jgi:hypothetical protein
MRHLDVPIDDPLLGASNVPLANYLRRRGAAYSVRVPVPKDLWEQVGKREIVKALGKMRDPTEAKRKGPAAVQEIHAWSDRCGTAPSSRAR